MDRAEGHRPDDPLWVNLVLIALASLVVWLAFAQARGPARFGRDLAQGIEVWYADPSYQFLVPTVQPIGSAFRAGRPIAQVALDLLKQPPAGLVSPVPGAEAPLLLVATASEATVQVSTLASVGASQERLLIGAVVRTLTALPGIGTVRIRAVDAAGRPREGHEDTSRPFSARSPEVRNAWDSPGTVPITVWFKLAGSDYLVPLDMASPIAEKPLEGAIAALSQGPPPGASGLEPAVPPESGLRYLGRDGTAMRVEWAQPDVPADPAAQRRLIAATVLTATERGDFTRVRFLTPAGALTRKVGPFDLARDLLPGDARSVLQLRPTAPSGPIKKAS